MANQKLGMNMIRAKRMSYSELFGGHGVKNNTGLQKIIKKAQELEDARLEGND